MTPTSPEERLSITVAPDEGSVTMVLAGAVDPYTVPLLQTEIDRLDLGALSTLTLDLDGVSFMDSAGLRVLVALRKAAIATDSRVVVGRASDATRRVLELTGLWDEFTG